MTTEQRKQVESAIKQCDRYIDKEGSRSADLRPAQTQKLLDWYIQHRSKLQGMLEGTNK